MKIEKKYLSSPLTAQIEITDFCNHQCVHCYNLDSKIENRPVRNVSDETVLACAQKLIDSGIFSVIVTGGEPLIKKELTKKVIRLFYENNIRVSLNSNLTLFDDDFIAFLKEMKVGVLTSCPSGTPSSFKRLVGIDNYGRFEKNLKKLLASSIHFTVNMVITKDNLHEIRPTAELMKRIGCSSFAATPMGLNMEYPRLDLLLSVEDVRHVISDLLWVEATLNLKVDILEALPKCVFPENILMGRSRSFLNRKCQAGRTVIAVSCNGDVRPCAHNPVSYGNILEESLTDIWKKMADWRSSQYIPKECKECTWLHRCNGGCRTSAKTFGGKWDSKEMWATSPITLLYSKDNEKKTVELCAGTKLQKNTNYRIRKEEDDAYVVYNIKDDVFFMVNKACRDFIIGLNGNTVLNYSELAKEWKTDINNQSFFDIVLFLVEKGVLNIVKS